MILGLVLMLNYLPFCRMVIGFGPPARSEVLVNIQSQLPGIAIGTEDVPVWKSRRGIYSCSETWNSLRTKVPEVPWWQIVWFPLAIP